MCAERGGCVYEKRRKEGIDICLFAAHKEFGRLSCYILLLSQIFFYLVNGNGMGIHIVDPRKLYDGRERVYRNNNLPHLWRYLIESLCLERL